MTDSRKTASARLPGVLLLWSLALAVSAGCSKEQAGSTSSATDDAADSVAYTQAVAIEDEGARLTALRALVDHSPASRWSARAYPRVVSLAREHAPSEVPGILRRFSETDYAAPEPYNMVGWDLAENGEHLDLAIPILEKAVARARAGGDSLMIASCLDSEAWARYKAGDHAKAVERMEEAYALYGPGTDEIDEHMAFIYDAAGMDEKAAPIYKNLLGHMEHPEVRGNLEAIVRASGGSLDDMNREIAQLREATKAPAPDFSGPSLADGSTLSVKDFRGKVVLLNFWHPT
jgi:hypothetical protein